MSIDEVMEKANAYSLAVHDGRDGDCASGERDLRAAIEQHVAEAVAKERDRWRPALDAVVREFDHREEGRDGNAPGHGHSIPGVWDEDNGPIAGTTCAWCATWKIVRELLDTEAIRARADRDEVTR